MLRFIHLIIGTYIDMQIQAEDALAELRAGLS